MDPYVLEGETLKALSGEISILEFFKELEPKTFNYEALRSAYVKYKKLAAKGTQQKVSFPSKAVRGDSGNYIRDLQKRLQQEGFYSGNITGIYDTETQARCERLSGSTPDWPRWNRRPAHKRMAKRLISRKSGLDRIRFAC